jgi:hypothetical protein
MARKSHAKWRPTSKFLIEKYIRRQQGSVLTDLEGTKGRDLPVWTNYSASTIRAAGTGLMVGSINPEGAWAGIGKFHAELTWVTQLVQSTPATGG